VQTKQRKPPTATEQRLLRLVARSVDRNGFQPSYREIAEHFGWASAGYVTVLVRSLWKKGIVSPKGSRALSFDWRTYL
jgi:SOS-response transcriptional repressor LexA